MQVTETSADGLKREYTITVPASDLEREITRRLGEIGQQVRLPGFRPGKVPMQILRTRFGPSVRGEVLQSTLQASSAEAISERQLRPALPPKVDISLTRAAVFCFGCFVIVALGWTVSSARRISG